MLPANIKELIARLDPGTLTAFAGSLTAAEAVRLGMPADHIVLSDEINDTDEGLDALLSDVPDARDSELTCW